MLAIWAAIAIELCKSGFWLMAVYLVWLVATYMRPGEPLKIRRGDLVAPVRHVSHEWMVNLFPEERLHRSKALAANESVSLLIHWAPWFSQLVPLLAKGPSHERVFDFDYPTFFEIFNRARSRLKFPKMSPYEARHSGPAIDVARGFRTKAEVKERGRWKNDKSVQRYEQRARLAVTFRRLPLELQAHCRRCEDALGDVLLGRRQPEDV